MQLVSLRLTTHCEEYCLSQMLFRTTDFIVSYLNKYEKGKCAVIFHFRTVFAPHRSDAKRFVYSVAELCPRPIGLELFGFKPTHHTSMQCASGICSLHQWPFQPPACTEADNCCKHRIRHSAMGAHAAKLDTNNPAGSWQASFWHAVCSSQQLHTASTTRDDITCSTVAQTAGNNW